MFNLKCFICFDKKSIVRLVFLFCVVVALVWSYSYLYQPNIPVLCYHEVENNVDNPLALSSEEFEEQMQFLYQNGYKTITPDQLLDHLQKGVSLPDKAVLITFDDGYQNNFTNAYPIMRKYGFEATIFLVTDYVGHNNWYLNWDQVKEMQRNGFVFGSHTLSHVPLTSIPEEEVMFQLIKSREAVEWRLGTPVRYFAYPGGNYSNVIENIVRQAGYRAAFSIDFGGVKNNSNVYRLNRIPIFKSSRSFVDFYLRFQFTPIFSRAKTVKDHILHFIRTIK